MAQARSILDELKKWDVTHLLSVPDNSSNGVPHYVSRLREIANQ